MGCINSSPNRGSQDPTRTTAQRNSNPLTEKEIQARIDAPKHTQTVTIGGVTYKYAWVSQRGYYPDCTLLIIFLFFSL